MENSSFSVGIPMLYANVLTICKIIQIFSANHLKTTGKIAVFPAEFQRKTCHFPFLSIPIKKNSHHFPPENGMISNAFAARGVCLYTSLSNVLIIIYYSSFMACTILYLSRSRLIDWNISCVCGER